MNTHVAMPIALYEWIVAALEDAQTRQARLLLAELAKNTHSVSVAESDNVKPLGVSK